MKSQLQTAGLIALLFVLTLALGIEFVGSGLSGAPVGPGQTKMIATKGAATTLPEFVLKAEGINAADLYESSFYQYVPPSMLVPLRGLSATLTALGKPLPASHGRVQSLTLVTNSSGIAVTFDLPGNYTVLISSAYYQLDTVVSLSFNLTTTLTFTPQPSAEAVDALRIVSPDSITGVGPATRLYALVDKELGQASGFAELVGFENGNESYWPSGTTSVVSVGPLVEVNTTVAGEYPGTQGFWAALSPSGYYPGYPSVGVLLFQYRPLYEVNYTAG